MKLLLIMIFVASFSLYRALAVRGAEADPIEVYTWAEQPTSAATEQTRWSKDLELRPSNTPSDVMRLAPSLMIGQHHGGGKADQILFRGFDSDHGTDFQVSIDGIPVNMPSHAHGQGYADMHWLIPETIDRVEIFKGSYFPHLGDFATSGAINIVTKAYARNSSLTAMGGSYETARFLGILSAPEGTPFRPYMAFEYFHNDGPFKNPAEYNRYNFYSRINLIANARSNLDFLATYFSTNWNASGEIPSRAVRNREFGRFGAVDSSEGGNSERQNLSLIYNFADANQSLRAQTWMSWYRLQLWSNFSLFLNNPVEGDGIEQNDKRYLIGNNVTYRRNYTIGDIPTETLLGFQSRFDHIKLGLFNQEKRHRLSTTNDNIVQQTNLSWFVHQEIRPTNWFRGQLGARLDNFWWNVRQAGPATQPIAGAASESIASPKMNLIFTPFTDNQITQKTNLFFNVGGGFHSNDARVVVQDQTRPLARFWGGEIGMRTRLLENMEFSTAYWRSYLSSELVFVGDEGTFEPSGASKRHGIEAEFRYDILPWLTYDLDASYSWARFTNGEAVPLAPRALTFTGLTARHDSGVQARLQMRYVGSRYGIEDRSIKTPQSAIFDLFLKYIWQRYEFFVVFQNLANTKWRSAEHVFTSRLQNEPPDGVLGSSFTPGDPFTAKAGVTINIW
ncbi:MAG: TonB-dependent receptor [Candidatus Binatia bacterium]|jgi:outer membrane receptor protein involved in Fe transport